MYGFPDMAILTVTRCLTVIVLKFDEKLSNA
jgi:hypothetical protein